MLSFHFLRKTGADLCEAMFPNPIPPIPYGEQTQENSLFIENGFKVGNLFETNFIRTNML